MSTSRTTGDRRFCPGCNKNFLVSTFARHVAQSGNGPCHQIWQRELLGGDSDEDDVAGEDKRMSRPAPLLRLHDRDLDLVPMDVDTASVNCETSSSSESEASLDEPESDDPLPTSHIRASPRRPDAPLGVYSGNELDEWNGISSRLLERRDMHPPATLHDNPPRTASPEPLIEVSRNLRDGTYIETYAAKPGEYSDEWEDPTSHFLESREHANFRRENRWWPCNSQMEFEMLSMIQRFRLSESQTNELLKSQFFKSHQTPLSFRNAKEAKDYIEMLPSGPRWRSSNIEINGFPSKKPITLFWKDSLDAAQFQFGNPIFADHIVNRPHRVYNGPDKKIQYFSEVMSGSWAWYVQKSLDSEQPGGTVLTIILAMDKTVLSVGTGHQSAVPLYLAVGNINSSFRNKDSYHGFLLIGLLPIANFGFGEKDSELQSLMQNRLNHWCLDFILKPLKEAAEVGAQLHDPLGNIHRCYPVLASLTVDLKEAWNLTCVQQSRSPVTLAWHLELGDGKRHERRTGRHTLDNIQKAIDKVDPWTDIGKFMRHCKGNYGLSGVHRPFWRDWRFANPSVFVTPDALHGWLGQFYKHDWSWIKKAVGKEELNFRYKVMQPIVGRRHFASGVSSFTQATGQTHTDLHRYHIVAIDGQPPEFQRALAALATFRYLAMMDVSSTTIITKMENALKDFHSYKDIIYELGLRNSPHFAIPKLEMMLNVAYSAVRLGAPYQFTTSTSEHAHVEVKSSYRGSNRKELEEQICRDLDRSERLRVMDLLSGMAETDITSAIDRRETGAEADPDPDSKPHWLAWMDTVQPLTGPKRPPIDYFTLTKPLKNTFYTETTAFHLMGSPDLVKIEDAALQFHLVKDFYPALADYLSPSKRINKQPTWFNPRGHGVAIGGQRQSNSSTPISYTHIRVWNYVSIQTKSFQIHRKTNRSMAVQAQPPDSTWVDGRCDTCILKNYDPEHGYGKTVDLKKGTLSDYLVAQIRIVFQLVAPRNSHLPEPYLAYAQRFDVVPQASANGTQAVQPDLNNNMWVLKRAYREDRSRMGDVIELKQILTPAEVAPKFGNLKEAESAFTTHNALKESRRFYLNHYCDKEIFYMFLDMDE